MPFPTIPNQTPGAAPPISFPPDSSGGGMFDFLQGFDLTSIAGGFASGLTGGLTGEPSGVNDSGFTDASQTNIVGNFNPDMAEVLRMLNEGSAANGSNPTMIPGMFGSGSATTGLSANVSALGSGAGFQIGPMVLIGGGAVLLFLLSRRRRG